MEVGLNNDITVNGLTYHIQTEDWGRQNPYLVTQVFSNGAVLKSWKISYWQVLPQGPISDSQAIRLALRQQHQKILDRILSGQFDW
ncbi:MAG: hypothetical protein AB7F59_11020 [Bdellovibrionales bacterium]